MHFSLKHGQANEDKHGIDLKESTLKALSRGGRALTKIGAKISYAISFAAAFPFAFASMMKRFWFWSMPAIPCSNGISKQKVGKLFR